MHQEEVRSLSVRLRELTARQESRDKLESALDLRRAIEAAITGLEFRDGRSKLDFAQSIAKSVREDHDGTFVSDDGASLDEVVQREYSRRHSTKQQATIRPAVNTEAQPLWDVTKRPTTPEEIELMRRELLRAFQEQE